MNKIDELSLAHLGVEDGLYLVLLFSIDNERGKRSWGSTRDGIRTILLQKADMEDRMDLHGLGQVEAVRSSTDCDKIRFSSVQSTDETKERDCIRAHQEQSIVPFLVRVF